MEDKFILSALESALLCSLIEDLEKEIILLKFAALKSTHELSEAVLKGRSAGKVDESSRIKLDSRRRQIQGPPDLKSEASLEVSLEYSKLKREFELTKGRDYSKDKGIVNSIDLAFSNTVDYILEVLQKTRKSLKETNSFACFVEEVDKKVEELNRESKLQSDINRVKNQISKLKKDIVSIQEKTRLDEKEKLQEINRLRDQQFLVESDGKETLKVTESFFEARETISKTNHQEEMAAQSKQISETSLKIDRDVHCLATMEAWTDNFCEKLEEEIDKWKLKLRKDEMLMDMRIDAKRRHIKEQEDLMKNLNEIIAQRLEELAPWEEEKEVERQERLAHMRRYYSARKIQRWWRGYMIKLKLYRRRKTKAKA